MPLFVRRYPGVPSLSGPEDGEIQIGWLPQPGSMRRMVFKIIASQPVHQYVEPLPVLVQPRDQRIELAGVERKLTTPVRMGANRLLVHAPDNDPELFSGAIANGPCLFDRVLIEVHMGVILRMYVLWSLDHDDWLRCGSKVTGSNSPAANHGPSILCNMCRTAWSRDAPAQHLRLAPTPSRSTSANHNQPSSRIGNSDSSTRRFSARPSAVALSAIGLFSPAPIMMALSRTTPLAMRYCATVFARRSDKD